MGPPGNGRFVGTLRYRLVEAESGGVFWVGYSHQYGNLFASIHPDT